MSLDYIKFEDKDWLYHTNGENVRYSLGEKGERGENPLICFGINPSTAKPNALDNTLKQVQARAKNNNYDGWIMFNLYPLRATDPKQLPISMDKQIHEENRACISHILSHFSHLDVWCAWGSIIHMRAYLPHCLQDIHQCIKSYNLNYITLENSLCKNGDPGHPLYKRKDLKFVKFDMEKYLLNFK